MNGIGSRELSIVIKHKYFPLQKQSLFHLSGAKYRLYIGAWRAGKTFAGCQEAFKQCILYPGNCGLIGRKDFTDLRDTTIQTFFEVVPPESIKNYNKTEHICEFKNGSKVLFRELKDGAGLGSLNLGFFYIDEAEQVQESIFDRLQGRLSLNTVGRQCGWITSNPPNEDHWLYDRFVKSDDPDFAVFYASTYENKQNLPEGYIDSLEKLPPSWKKKYLEGQFGFTPDGKPFYEGYAELTHKRDFEVDRSLPLDCGWDFGFRHPAFVVTQQNKNRWIILDEIMGKDVTIEDFAQYEVIPLLNSKYADMNIRHYGDPAGGQVNDKSTKTSIQILDSLGIKVKCRPSTYALRKELIGKRINTFKEGVPLLVCHSRCKIINDGFLGGYHYPEVSDKGQYGIRSEEPFKDGYYDHCMNGLEYVAVNVFKPVENQRMTANRISRYRQLQRQRQTDNAGIGY